MAEELESLGERIAEQAAHLDAAMHRLLTDLRAFDRGGGWHAQGARSCAQWLSWRVGWGLGAAREHVRVADRLAALPLLDDALRRGELSYAKLRAITRVATPANEAALLEIARHTSGHQLENVCRKYRVVMLHDADPDPEHDRQRRWVARRDTADGMVRIEAVLHPEEAALIWAALDQLAQQRCLESQRVSAESASSAPTAAPAAAGAALDHGAEQQYLGSQRVPAESASSAPTAAPAAAGAALDHRAEQQCRESQRVSAESASSAPTAAPTAAPAAAGTALDYCAQQQCRESQRVPAESASSAPTAAPVARDDARDDARNGGAHVHSARSRPPFDRADALVQLAQGYLRGDRPDRSPIEIVVTVPAETLRRRRAVAPAMTMAAAPPGSPGSPATASSRSPDAGMATAVPNPSDPSDPIDPCDIACLADGTCVSAETARRLGCDCGVIEIVEGEHGAPLSLGRKRRTIPGSMKRALLQRDRTCRFPGCGNRLYLEAHHVVHWADGGDTSLRNMVACCSFHHRFVHEYGYSIELHADGPHFLDRRGRRILDTPPPPRPPDLGWEAIGAQHAELALTASVNEPLWDGARIDYGAVIDVLVSIEEAEARQDGS